MSADCQTLEEKLSLWNLRPAPASRPVSATHLSDVVLAAASYLPASYCHYCQNAADLSAGVCKRCDRIQLIRECAAEGLGMFLMMFVGTAATAQYYLSSGYQGNFLAQALTWGVAVTFGIYVAQGVSGGHLSPGITVSLALFRGYPWRRVLPLILTQLTAAFLAALIIFLEFKDWIYYREALVWTQRITPTATIPAANAPLQLTAATAPIFVVAPAAFVSTGGMIFDQFIGAAAHAIGFAALLDWKNSSAHAPGNLMPLMSGLWVFAIIASFSGLSFYPFNVARNLGMQFGAATVGYTDVFYAREWTFVVFPILGSVAGMLLYDLCVRLHHKPQWPYLWTINYAKRLQLQGIQLHEASALSAPAAGSAVSSVHSYSPSTHAVYSALPPSPSGMSLNSSMSVRVTPPPIEGVYQYRSRPHHRSHGSASERLPMLDEGKRQDSSPISVGSNGPTGGQPGDLELGELRH